MKRRIDRLGVVKQINIAAQSYRDRLVGKSFMYVFNSRHIEVIFKVQNFKHLTGVESQLSAKRFYSLAKGRAF